MNENIDLTKILKDCPRGFKLYSAVHGEVTFWGIEDGMYPICVLTNSGNGTEYYSSGGKLYASYGRCILFPSEEQQDWSKFVAPWLKEERFDPKTLQPFDKVLVRDRDGSVWFCEFFSHILKQNAAYKYATISAPYRCCIPYNEETRHLVGTTDEAPEYYRYW